MDLRPHVELVRDLLSAMGQDLGAARPVPEGLALRTEDGYLYVFAIDPNRGSNDSVRRWRAEADVPSERLVVFSLRTLPGPWGPEIVSHGGQVVQGAAFERLVRDLGIETSLLPMEPGGSRGGASVLPSVRGLEAEMHRADTWYSSGVLPLALRFYRAAASLKPEYLPAVRGIARSLAEPRAAPEALVAWDRVLELAPGDGEARLGRAVALGAMGRHAEELRALRALAKEQPSSNPVRVALFSAYVERADWKSAREEVERLLDTNPRDPRLRFLHAEALARVGLAVAAADEREQAERLGLSPDEAARLRKMIGRSDGTPDRVS